MDHLLLLASKSLTMLLTFQIIAELQHTDKIIIITKTQLDITLNTIGAKSAKEKQIALHQSHNLALHKYNHTLECS